MWTLIGGALTIGLLLMVIWIAIRAPRRFSLHRAMMRPRTVTGPLVAVWLALVSGISVTLDVVDLSVSERGVDPTNARPLALVVATTLLIIAVLLVVAPKPTVFVLSMVGILAWGVQITRDRGVATAVQAIVLAMLVTWIFGFLRGWR